jgi:hypothetical protein
MKSLKEGSQNARILGHLAHGRSLTQISAYRLFDCVRLPSRIRELRQRGHKITREMIDLSSGKTVARYSLEQRRT